MIESKQSALYRSDDAGKSWKNWMPASSWCGVRFILPT